MSRKQYEQTTKKQDKEEKREKDIPVTMAPDA